MKNQNKACPEALEVPTVASSLNGPKQRVRWYPADVHETFEGTVIEETKYSYLVIPDDNLTGTARWDKKYCEII